MRRIALFGTVAIAAIAPVTAALAEDGPLRVPVPRPNYGWLHLNGSGWDGIPESAGDRLWTAYYRSPFATGYPVGTSPETVGAVSYNRGPGPRAANPPPVGPDRVRIAVEPALFQLDPLTGEYVMLSARDTALALPPAPLPVPLPAGPIPLLPSR